MGKTKGLVIGKGKNVPPTAVGNHFSEFQKYIDLLEHRIFFNKCLTPQLNALKYVTAQKS